MYQTNGTLFSQCPCPERAINALPVTYFDRKRRQNLLIPERNITLKFVYTELIERRRLLNLASAEQNGKYYTIFSQRREGWIFSPEEFICRLEKAEKKHPLNHASTHYEKGPSFQLFRSAWPVGPFSVST